MQEHYVLLKRMHAQPWKFCVSYLNSTVHLWINFFKNPNKIRWSLVGYYFKLPKLHGCFFDSAKPYLGELDHVVKKRKDSAYKEFVFATKNSIFFRFYLILLQILHIIVFILEVTVDILYMNKTFIFNFCTVQFFSAAP